MIETVAVRSNIGTFDVACVDIFDECLLKGASIPGNIYHDYIYHVTGVSLYEEDIDPELVEYMAEEIHYHIGDKFELSVDEQLELAQWLKVCSNHGLGLMNFVKG